MTGTEEATGVQWGLVGAAMVFVLVGLAAYRGVAKPFWLTLWPRATLGFGLLWGGVAGVLAGLCWPLFTSPVADLLVGIPIVVGWVLLLLSFFWLPRSLQPEWYREHRDWQRSVRR
ncbi:hypothetical protein [Nocardioides sp. CER19]|uniref:hypothetical protein n=1 Tax=Nocardioides sp. CER19 TaxID=3038538 RepID=UPI00244CFCCB|nr:hypothetical protein [Nocardioides sp. CER19]MDH2412725.1 hypothetical protein [Nocardioides sp. CER19]